MTNSRVAFPFSLLRSYTVSKGFFPCAIFSGRRLSGHFLSLVSLNGSLVSRELGAKNGTMRGLD